jgi:hypothetical protein
LTEIKSKPGMSGRARLGLLETEMVVREAIYGRRAIRKFTTEPVDEAASRRLIDALRVRRLDEDQF